MNRHAETINNIDGYEAKTQQSEKTQLNMCKEEWIRHYAGQMLKLWQAWQTRLGVARDYVEQLKADLSELYEEPLKRMFIETTY
jgi:hypothetical protein